MDFTTTTLSSTRLRLTAFQAEDAAEIFAAVTPTLTRFMAFDPSPSFDAFSEVSSAWFAKMASGTDLFLVVRLALTGEFLGLVGLHNIGDEEAEAGVWIKEASHGFGYGREAVSALVGWAAGATGVQRITYPVVEYNHPSRRVAESLGGVVVGSRRLRKTDDLDHPTVIYRIPVPRSQ
ncbi:GNAT family N-acetyltransferase [Pleomorphomonas sp. PLEO]|uniref:GNAT family N-acetyltransferase n=1 Tax=Pleomorphomonas sp. PLEO TaxID=3239306 RepID=UPI00351E41FF